MEGSLYTWQLTYEPGDGSALQIPVQIMVTGPGLQMATMNHIIFHILVPDIIHQFPIETYQNPPNTISLDYAPNSDMLSGFRVTMAGHGACK